MKWFRENKIASIMMLLVILMTGIVFAGAVTEKPYGISTPMIYDYTSGAKGSYYLDIPTLSANDTFCGLTTTQTLTNKTLTSPTVNTPTVTTPAITGGTITSGTFLDFAATELTATGAISASVSYVELNHASVAIAATIAAPSAGRFLVITQTDAGTAGHTVTLTAGTYDGSNNVATFNAQNETLVLFAISATRFVVVENIGSVGLGT